MVAMLSTLAVGSFARVDKPKKHKHCEHCTKTQCSPDCKANGACDGSHCSKA